MPTLFRDEAGNEVMYFATNPGMSPSDHHQSVMRDDGTFGPATPVDELNSPSNDLGITVRRDGLEVFLLSARRGGSGNKYSMDFWRSTRASTADAWSEPVFVPSLGSPAFAQGRIALSWDARELYFTSRRPGSNLQDIWVAHRDRVGGPK